MLTFKNANHTAAIYPDGSIKWIAIPAGGTAFDEIVANERNDGMLMFAINDANQRVALVAPDATCTDVQHDRLIQEVREWLDRLATVTYKGVGEKATCAKLAFGGLIVQPAQKTVMKDGAKSKAEADAIVQMISDWVKATTFKQPKSGGDGGDKPSGDDGKGGKPSGGDGGDKPTGGDKPSGGDGGDKPKPRTKEENFTLGAQLFNEAFAKLKGK